MLVPILPTTKEDIEEIISLESIKDFCREIGESNNASLEDMLLSAIEEAEGVTNRQLFTATYELVLSTIKPIVYLPKNPIQEILEIKYLENGDYITMDKSDYFLHEELELGQVVFEKIPGIKEHKQAVKIKFKCGYKKTNFPHDLKQWLKVKVSTLNEFREEFVSGVSVNKVTHVDSVLFNHRIRP